MKKIIVTIMCLLIVNSILACVGYWIYSNIEVLDYTFATIWGCIITLIDLVICDY